MTRSEAHPRVEGPPTDAPLPPPPEHRPLVVPRRRGPRRGTVLLTLVVLALLAAPASTAAVWSANQPVEVAAVVELIHQPEDGSTAEGVDREMATHQVLLQRRLLVHEVALAAGRTTDDLADDLSVEIVDGSSVLRLQVVDTDPDRARETLDDLVESYLAAADRLAATSDIGRLRVLAPPDVLDEPVGPQPLRAGAAGLLLGIFLAGLLLALVRLRRGRGGTT